MGSMRQDESFEVLTPIPVYFQNGHTFEHEETFYLINGNLNNEFSEEVRFAQDVITLLVY